MYSGGMNKIEATALWKSIIDYAQALASFEAEGNSGEFHDERDWIALQKDARTAEYDLKQKFAEATGWMPIFHDTVFEEGAAVTDAYWELTPWITEKELGA